MTCPKCNVPMAYEPALGYYVCTITGCGEKIPAHVHTLTACGECTDKRIKKLEAIAKAAERLICAPRTPRTEYRPGSKKAALRDALEALKNG